MIVLHDEATDITTQYLGGGNGYGNVASLGRP